MKKITQLFCLAVVLTIIGLSGCMPSNRPSADTGGCLAQMSDETTAHIRDRKIPLKGTDAQLFGNKEEQVYLVSSQEPVKLNSKEVAKNVVAVINHKEAGGKSNFYLIEQEITPEQITFVLSKDSKVLESLPIKLVLPRAAIPGPGGPDQGACQSSCDSIDADNDAQLQALLAEANSTCSDRGICLPMCTCLNGVQSIGFKIINVEPTSWRCRRNIAVEYYDWHFFALRNPGPFLDQAFDMAIKKEARLYAF